MTNEQKDNLRKLSEYLVSGKLLAEFDMSSYHDLLTGIDDLFCGSVGCSIGHGPYAGVPKLASEIWDYYVIRAFGVHPCSLEYDWLFSPVWKGIDGSAFSAGMRIYKFLTLGGVPDYFKSKNQF